MTNIFYESHAQNYNADKVNVKPNASYDQKQRLLGNIEQQMLDLQIYYL